MHSLFFRFLFVSNVFLISIGLTPSASAQSKTYVGVRAGAQLSSLNVTHNFFRKIITTRNLPGINAGIMVKHYTKKNVGLQLGIEYHQKGWKQHFFDLYPDYNAQINYLDLPIMMTAYLGKGKNKYFMNAGFFIEYLLGANLDNPPGDVEPFDFYTYDPDRDGRFGYGLRFGGGLSRDFSFGQIHLEGFFTFSLSNVFDPESRESEVPDISNNFLTGFSIAYLIPFGKLDLY